MAFWSSIPVLGQIIDVAADELDGWRERRNAKLETELTIEKAKQESLLKRAEQEKAHEIDWDVEMAKASGESWKDEWLTVVFSIPLIACFVPGLEHWVLRGFEVLAQTPDWYVYALSVIVAASFGVRKVVGKLGHRKRQ